MKPHTLKIMEALDGRTIFNDEQKRYLWNMQSGYRGECEFVGVMDSLICPHILLRDLYFEPKFSGVIQIDFLLLVGNTAIIYEVKNYTGVWQHVEDAYRQKNLSVQIRLFNWRGRSKALNHCFENSGTRR